MCGHKQVVLARSFSDGLAILYFLQLYVTFQEEMKEKYGKYLEVNSLVTRIFST